MSRISFCSRPLRAALFAVAVAAVSYPALPAQAAPGAAGQPAAAGQLATAAAPVALPDPLLGGRWPLPAAAPLIVDVVDHTGWAWPVRAAAASWSSPQAVEYDYVGQCQLGVPCVEVTESWLGATGWQGLTTLWPVDGRYTSPARIQLNDSYPSDLAQRRHVVCQELGHALGLNHNNRPGSCMQYDGTALTPDSGDQVSLHALYQRL